MSKRLFGYICGTAVTGTLCLLVLKDVFVAAWAVLFSFLIYALWYNFTVIQNDNILPKSGDKCYLVVDCESGARVIFAHIKEVCYNENVDSESLEMVVETYDLHKWYTYRDEDIGVSLFFDHKDAVKAVERKVKRSRV